MKATHGKTLVSTIFALAGALIIPCLGHAQAGPTGQFTNVVNSVSNLVWDVTSVEDVSNVEYSVSKSGHEAAHLQFDTTLDQSGTGKFSGSGTNTVNLEFDDPGVGWTTNAPFLGTYKVSGTIASSKGVAHGFLTQGVTGIAPNMAGANRKVNSSQTSQFVIDSVAGTVTSVEKRVASAVGLGAVSEVGSPKTQPITDIFSTDGSWTLAMSLSTTNTTKVIGTASVTLSSGRVLNYAVKGVYKTTTQMSTLVLNGSDAESKGSVLQVVMNGNAVASVKGKISGQIVNLTF